MKTLSKYFALLFALVIFAPQVRAAGHGLKDVTVMIIRHAEKPESGYQLSPTGQQRAEAYAPYFKTFTVNGESLTPDSLFATADSKNSHRPRLTLEPLSHALGLKIEARIKDKNFQELTNELEAHKHGHHILICWHHGEIPALLASLGANPAMLLPKGKWPSEEFGWVMVLKFDHEGKLVSSQCVHEKLMPGDH